MKQHGLITLFLPCLFLATSSAFADDTFQSADEILYRAPDSTPCASSVFANALAANAHDVSELDDEETIEQWIRTIFARADVLQSVLKCPEFQSIDETDHIKLQPIKYTFPAGREIVINYETQPKILHQRINLATKRNVDKLNTPSPRIGDMSDNSVWTNTDPAWYAIMVTQHGALDEFVGPDKNNTISLEYIKDNINKIYPRGATCTSKSALATDSNAINVAMHKTVDIEKDTNDYYVAGDADLRWISYAEIGLDVVITVATMGGGAILSGVTKSARATRAMNGLRQTMRALRNSPRVVEYIKLQQRLVKSEQTIARLRKYQTLEKELARLDKVRDAAKYADKAKELEQASREIREIDKLTDATKYADNIKDLEKESESISKSMRDAAKADKDVQKYVEADKSYSELQKYRRAYKNLNTLRKNAKTGNVITRVWRAARASATGNKAINRGAKIARTSIKSGRVRDWLFQSTMRNIGKLGRLEAAGGALYGAISIAKDMYDWTETSTGEFTNGVEFAPLLLLSADDLAGQENIVNYGMWLLWSGDSISAADDDAAYLQSMDFAEKFHNDLTDTMEQDGNHSCDVDIYVVRPVLRNPDINPEIYYLIMNDTPWTTAE